MDRETVVIRKYENRRLYNTSNSRYINLDDVAEMIRNGVDVQVVDAATGEDITRVVLTQIIVEDAKAPGSAFPLDMLRQMVVSSGRLSQDSMLKYMNSIFDMYQSAFRAFVPPAGPPERSEEVDELKRRLAELERRVRPPRRPKKPKKS